MNALPSFFAFPKGRTYPGSQPQKPMNYTPASSTLQEQLVNWYNTTVDVNLEDIFPYTDYKG
jgi:hypothetical protein